MQLKDELTTQIDMCNTIQNNIHIIEKILIELQINEGIEQSKYENVLIISHNPDIIKQFSNVIQITNDGMFSNIFYT